MNLLKRATFLLTLTLLFSLTACRHNVTSDASSRSVAATSKPPTFNVAFFGFPDSDVAPWKNVVDGVNVRIDSFAKEQFAEVVLSQYDAIFVRAIGWTPSDADRAQLQNAPQRLVRIGFPQTLDFAREVSNVDQETLERLYAYFQLPCDENAVSGIAFLVEKFGAKIGAIKNLDGSERPNKFVVSEPIKAPDFGYFYWGAQVDQTYEAFEARRLAEGRTLDDDAPRIALFGAFLEPFKPLDRAPQDELIRKLEESGFNVYPIYNLKSAPQALHDCRPDLAIYFPRGRVLPNERAVDLFQDLNVPVLSAIELSTSEEEQRAQPIGATGSYFSLTTALPELDGVVEPTAIGTRDENEDGLVVRKALSERIDRLVARCRRWIELQRKSNADKKLAIFYYKAPGAAALTAQSLEVVDSLYNVLLRLKQEGYDLGTELPKSSAELERRIQREGKTIGQWELGSLERFVEEAKPEFVPENVYRRWFERYVPDGAKRKVVDVWGVPPGDYMTRDQGDEFGLLVPRISFGNVVLIPQPTTDVLVDAPYSPQGNEFDAVHGTGKAPPHFYLAAYLWARFGFRADAIVHFGTHGSLEFTQGKSAFLTESCFPDVLIGDLPHVYLYSINNIGEAFLAKRRSRATLVSHLTPPFIKSDLAKDLATLDDKMHDYYETDDPALKREYALSIVKEALQTDLLDDVLDLPEFQELVERDAREKFLNEGSTFSEKQLERLHKLLHRYENANITSGLHVLGRPWTEEQVVDTAERSTLEPQEAQARLRASFDLELSRFVDALNGKFIPPSTGGDFLVNPNAAPTGRNLAGLDVEKIPSEEAERVAARLTQELIDAYRDKHEQRYPRRVACTLWGGESTRTQGLGVAQVLWLLGVRIARDSRGNANGLELIPSQELGRPRVDVLVQTSGQFRDSFGSKLETIDRAVKLAAEAPQNEPFENFVRENSQTIARRLVEDSKLSEEEAQELSTARVFGATNSGSYGTGIMRLVERGDLWDSEEQIAERYLANMSGVYRNARRWGTPTPRLLEYNLDGVDLALQTRSSNVWGPAKLDHVYEFATLATAVRAKTGVDPEIWFDDLRAPTDPRVESARAALREELRTTLWNPKYLRGLQSEGASAAASTAKTVRNLFGWSVAQAKTIDRSVWEETKAVLVDDKHELGTREWFEQKNPAALQDMTAVMLETIRKDYWDADRETIEQLARLHAELVEKFGPSGSYESTGNRKLQEFVADALPSDLAGQYRANLKRATDAPKPTIQGLKLKEKTETTPETSVSPEVAPTVRFAVWLLTLAALLVASGFATAPRATCRR